MVRYARHCVCYVESFQMSGNIMGLACMRMVMGLACVRMVMGLACVRMILAFFSSRFGASILVETSTASITFGKLQFNPLCFALYEDSTALPSQWEDVSATACTIILDIP